MVDLDGKLEYSPIRMIKLGATVKGQSILQLFPNPVVQEMRITIPESWQNKKVIYELYDISGLMIKRLMVNSASQTEVFNMQDL